MNARLSVITLGVIIFKNPTRLLASFAKADTTLSFNSATASFLKRSRTSATAGPRFCSFGIRIERCISSRYSERNSDEVITPFGPYCVVLLFANLYSSFFAHDFLIFCLEHKQKIKLEKKGKTALREVMRYVGVRSAQL